MVNINKNNNQLNRNELNLLLCGIVKNTANLKQFLKTLLDNQFQIVDGKIVDYSKYEVTKFFIDLLESNKINLNWRLYSSLDNPHYVFELCLITDSRSIVTAYVLKSNQLLDIKLFMKFLEIEMKYFNIDE